MRNVPSEDNSHAGDGADVGPLVGFLVGTSVGDGVDGGSKTSFSFSDPLCLPSSSPDEAASANDNSSARIRNAFIIWFVSKGLRSICNERGLT